MLPHDGDGVCAVSDTPLFPPESLHPSAELGDGPSIQREVDRREGPLRATLDRNNLALGLAVLAMRCGEVTPPDDVRDS